MCLAKELTWDTCKARATVYFICQPHIDHTRKQIDTRPCTTTFAVTETVKSRSCHCAMGAPGASRSQDSLARQCTRKQGKNYYYFDCGNGLEGGRETEKLRQEFLNLKNNSRRRSPSSASSANRFGSRSYRPSYNRPSVDIAKVRIKAEDGNEEAELEQMNDHRRLMRDKTRKTTAQFERERISNTDKNLDREEKQKLDLKFKKNKVDHQKNNDNDDDDADKMEM